MFKRVLVLTDFSDSAARALELARENFPQAHIRLVHVIEEGALSSALATPSAGPGTPTHGLAERNRAWETQARERLAALGGGEVVFGQPAEVALRIARAGEIDAIVMGASGTSALERLLFGSVAERVVRESPVPVLTVRADGERAITPRP